MNDAGTFDTLDSRGSRTLTELPPEYGVQILRCPIVNDGRAWQEQVHYGRIEGLLRMIDVLNVGLSRREPTGIVDAR